jgi:dTDP-4-dehydrorhamnose 3,5-epimerase
MKFNGTKISGCYVIEPTSIDDDRGWFSRVFCKELFRTHINRELEFVQINHSFNHKKGTFRGMHYQTTPYCEDKLIRCISGRVMDFVLDIRKESPSYLQWISVELSAENQQLIFLPKGTAHGFQTLEDNSALIYHHSVAYQKDADRGILFDDLLVNIELPLPITLISEKDRSYHPLDNNFKGI